MIQKPIPITAGNDLQLMTPIKYTDGTIIDPSVLTDVVVKTGGAGTVLTHTVDGDYLCMSLTAAQKTGVYDLEITAKMGDRSVRDFRPKFYARTLEGPIIPDGKIVLDQGFVIIGSTDAELEAQKEAAAEAEEDAREAETQALAAKAEFVRKASAIGQVATSSDVTAAKQAVLTAIDGISIDTTTLAKEATVTGWINGAWAGFKTWIEGIVGTPKSGATYSTLFGAIEANAGGGGGGSLPAEAAEEIEFTAKALGYTGDMPGYAELTETECGTMVDTLAGQMMHADEDGEVDYLYALQMGYPDHTFTSAEMATIKAARDEYWEEHPIEN